ncbi:hypothetical protein HK100_003133 [Physocladia obscura]|uniref:FAD-binding FR-type domain-containing protein n=1 Tax=Physocladia obscura TaxID=109957 RepID=A0AAD5SUJ0_9FUNG|nr:hypothetical protein HK100_003133 [Physocladia obscura]
MGLFSGSTRKNPLRSYATDAARKHIVIGVWIAAQVGYFIQSYYVLSTTPVLATFRLVLGPGLMIARAAANIINLNCALILLTVCKNILSLLRATFLGRLIPFDENIDMHILIAYGIIFWSVVHSLAHFYNFYAVELFLTADVVTAEYLNLLSGPGLTGQIISVVLFLMGTSAMEATRRKQFEIFWFLHHLFIVFFGGILMHGAFCLIKGDTGDICRGGPLFWKFWIGGAVLYIAERIGREIRARSRTYISKAVQHPSRVVEVQIMKPSCKPKAGQYISICCPEISPYQWHPFTLTSSPDEKFISVHINAVGDWTKEFATRLGCRFDEKGGKNVELESQTTSLPYLLVDGPYGTISEDVFDYEVGVLVGGGIGVTPFASILKTIWYRSKQENNLNRLKKVYFIWVCRDKEAFEWFQDLLLTIEEDIAEGFLEIRTYFTGKIPANDAKRMMLLDREASNDLVTGLKSRTFFGRPNFDLIFKEFGVVHPKTDVGVFFCGPKPLGDGLHKACNTQTNASETGTKFYFGTEHF